MQKTVQAVYEGGVLHPLEPLLLHDRQQVTVTVSDEAGLPKDHPLLVSPNEWADAALEEIPLEEVRLRLASIQGSLSETIIEERRDR
jgi:predicted DNA-binding antitoxin AbrB/MazE fold protein